MASQFRLLAQRRFLPYFVTQFLGAFNDNVYRIALLVVIAEKVAKTDQDQAYFLVNACMVLFILPFFLFSATAGEIADKFDKAKLIRKIKFAEIVIMGLVGLAFYLDSVYFLMTLLFLMGTQSTFFGPIKYSILPQHLKDTELVGGNGLVEMGTFIAILLGNIVGGLIVGFEDNTPLAITTIVVSVAVVGWFSSMFIPRAPLTQTDPKLKVSWEPISEIWKTLKLAVQKRAVFLSMLGISWFWLYGSSFLTQLPNYNIMFLHGDEQVFTLLLAAFSIGIGVGSLLCEKLSGHRVEIGLVPFGAIGLTVFAADLSFAHGPLPEVEIGFREFINNSSNWRMLIDLVLMGIFGGFYIVPLYVILQHRSDPELRSRIIAANNILNALFMAVGAGIAFGLLVLGLTIPQFFLCVAILNMLVAIFIFWEVPEFLMRFIIWILIHSLYRVDAKGLENIPDEGPVIICANHVSFLDPLIIMACVRRPIRFVMDHNIFKIPFLRFLFKTAGCIPIAPHKEDPEIKAKAFETVAQGLREGQAIGIFPEGGLTADGDIQKFKPGVDTIVKGTPVPVIPVALQGMWGSWYSRRHGRAMLHLPRKFIWAKVGLRVGKPIPPEELDREKLREIIKEMRGDKR